jgi:hypothetical protein
MATTNREMTPGALEVELFIDGGRHGGGSWPPITDPYSELAIGVAGPTHPAKAPHTTCATSTRRTARSWRTPSAAASTRRSANGSCKAATAPSVARHRTAIGRAGDVHITQNEDGVLWVGGTTSTDIAGTVEL